MGSPPAAAAASIARPPVHATRNSCRHSYINKIFPLDKRERPAKAGRSHCLQGAGKRGIEKTAKVYNF